MAKYKIWVDEEGFIPRIANDKDEAIKIFDEETKRVNEKYGYEFMTVAEMIEEQDDDFDNLIEGCDFIYCEKI